jgi:hypothetical protein
MYDKDTYRFAQHDLVYAMLQKTHCFVKEAKLDFLRRLLYAAAINGEVDEQEVEYAIKYSHVFNYCMTQDERDECLSWMNYQGKRYLGKLSRDQREGLQRLYELCEQVIREGNLSALQQVADLI